jgi:hypothetical protein
MNIEITRPEARALLQKSLRESGHSEPEDVTFQALREYDAKPKPQPALADRFTNLADLLLDSPFVGAGLNLERTRDYPSPVEIE